MVISKIKFPKEKNHHRHKGAELTIINLPKKKQKKADKHKPIMTRKEVYVILLSRLMSLNSQLF